MSIRNQNRFQVLSEDIVNKEKPQIDMDTTLVLQGEQSQHDIDTTSMVENTHKAQKQDGEEGWYDDLADLSDGEDNDVDIGTTVIEDNNRHRKVSSGTRAAHTPNMTAAFQITPTRHRSRGRGGGLLGSTPETTVGLLPPITELTETEIDVNPPVGLTDKDHTGIMATSVLPDIVTQEEQTTTFTFRLQLTCGLDKGTRVNLPDLFRKWVEQTSSSIPDFALLPFEDEKGQVITKPAQIPDDNPSFYQEYYYNHRVLDHGNLTGMVHFKCSVTWNKIKRMKEPYFQWLHQNKVYLNLTKYKSATLVVCGFLVGAHPGHLRRDDAEKELRSRLQLPPDFPFQLSSRTISVPMDNSKEADRFSFPAVAIETSTRQAKTLREAFFSQPKPSVAAEQFPYTGPYQFVPMLQSKEWPIMKIFRLAKAHVKLCDSIKVIHLQNLQDIRNVIGTGGYTLMKGFLGMTAPVEGKGTHPLIQSIHNTGRPTVKAVLVYHEHYDYALEHLAAIHQVLLSGVPQEYHGNVFVDAQEVGLTSSHRDTIQSCNSSQHANE
jgi:hypothetical protein